MATALTILGVAAAVIVCLVVVSIMSEPTPVVVEWQDGTVDTLRYPSLGGEGVIEYKKTKDGVWHTVPVTSLKQWYRLPREAEKR